MGLWLSDIYKEIDKMTTYQDFDGDSRADILWRDIQTGQVYIWLQDGFNTIQRGYAIDTDGVTVTDASLSQWSIKGLGDFNGDRKTDILWRDNQLGSVYLWHIDGFDTVSRGYITDTDGITVLNVPHNQWVIKGIGDFDADGNADILWRDIQTGEVYLWLQDGFKTISRDYVRYGDGIGIAQASLVQWEIKGIGDFNGDNKSDILWQNLQTGTTYIWHLDGFTILSMGDIFDTNGIDVTEASLTQWSLEGVGDFNGDNKSDILWRDKLNGSLYIWHLDGHNTISRNHIIDTGGIVGLGIPHNQWVIRGIADFTGDRKADILWRDIQTGAAYLWHQDGFYTVLRGNIIDTDGITLMDAPLNQWDIKKINNY